MSEDTEIEHDLVKHLDHKIRMAVFDHLKLCRAVDISLSSAVPGALASVVMVAASIAKLSHRMTANDFAGVCFQAFEQCESHKKERRHDRGE